MVYLSYPSHKFQLSFSSRADTLAKTANVLSSRSRSVGGELYGARVQEPMSYVSYAGPIPGHALLDNGIRYRDSDFTDG